MTTCTIPLLIWALSTALGTSTPASWPASDPDDHVTLLYYACSGIENPTCLRQRADELEAKEKAEVQRQADLAKAREILKACEGENAVKEKPTLNGDITGPLIDVTKEGDVTVPSPKCINTGHGTIECDSLNSHTSIKWRSTEEPIPEGIKAGGSSTAPDCNTSVLTVSCVCPMRPTEDTISTAAPAKTDCISPFGDTCITTD